MIESRCARIRMYVRVRVHRKRGVVLFTRRRILSGGTLDAGTVHNVMLRVNDVQCACVHGHIHTFWHVCVGVDVGWDVLVTRGHVVFATLGRWTQCPIWRICRVSSLTSPSVSPTNGSGLDVVPRNDACEMHYRQRVST